MATVLMADVLIPVADTLQTVKSSDIIALEQIEIAKAENEALLVRIAAAQEELEANVEKANADLEAKRQQYDQELQAAKAELDANVVKANKDLDDKRAQYQAERAADLATIEANAKQAIEEVTAAQGKVEAARGQLTKDIEAVRDSTLTTHQALKAELLAAGNIIHAGATADKAWAAPIIQQGIDAIQKQLDEIMEGHAGLIGWIKPKPVDQAKIAEVIARDMKTLQVIREPEK